MGTSGGSGITTQSDLRYYAGSTPSDRGFIAWNMPIEAAAAAAVLSTAGRLEFSRIRRVPAGPASNLLTLCNTAGNTLTSGQCFAALYTGAGALVAQTSDQAANWASTGLKTMALAGAPLTLVGGDYVVAFWFNGTGGPSFTRFAPSGGLASITNAGLSAPNFASGTTSDAGLTVTAPSNLGTQTSLGTEFWVGIS